MRTNIKGLVRSLELKQHQGMIPLFEAVSNSMDAIVETDRGLNKGKIGIQLLRKNELELGGAGAPPIDGLVVTDDGVGFNETNFAAFEEAYTQTKLRLGGKGLGRFTFLKVFEKVEITSHFLSSATIINPTIPR